MPIISIALFLFIVGFLFESMADQQMKAFKSNPDNSSKIMNQGFGNIQDIQIILAIFFNGLQSLSCLYLQGLCLV